MREKIAHLKIQFLVVVLVEILVTLAVFLLFGLEFLWLPLILIILNTSLFVYYMYLTDQERQDNVLNISRILGNEAKNALVLGGVGLVIYDENNVITWMSDIFEAEAHDLINTRIVDWHDALRSMFQENLEQCLMELPDRTYEVVRQSADNLLYFKDITAYQACSQRYQAEKLVLGLIHLDNYEEVTQYEDEQIISFIDTQIRQPIISWALNLGIIIKRIKSDRYLLVLNEAIFKTIEQTNFPILAEIRQKSQQYDYPITLSMAFAREGEELNSLDEALNRLLELAQSRGGDQAAYRRLGKEVKYFGGRSESVEKRSRVRVRVMSNTLRDLIVAADQVYIMGHQAMDFDSFGAALGMSRLAQNYHKPTFILFDEADAEEKLKATIDNFYPVLAKHHNFINEATALSQLSEASLLILVDHHHEKQASHPALINEIEKIVVIDHHRRSSDFSFEPLMVYVEASASSVCELIVEFFPYQNTHIALTTEEATIMMAGVIVDTLNFKKRTGSRTFEAASALKKYGADLNLVDEILKDNFDQFQMKQKIISGAKMEYPGIIIATYPKVVNRVLLSMVADELLDIKEVTASFVIGQLDDEQIGISARSTGKINVQAIMEKMSGGGHFSAAALQKEGTVDSAYQELKETITAYFKEEENESNSN